MFGITLQLEAGTVEQSTLKLTAAVASLGPACKLNFAFCPEVTDMDVEPPLAAPSERLAPVPVSAIICGLPGALSVIETDPILVPVAVGVKVTFKLQLFPTVTMAGQLLVTAKSPEADAFEIASGPVPLSVIITGWEALVEPTSCPLNVRLPVESITAGAVAIP
jgi:hypothetical protein